jgi:hypothetical protein
MNWNCTHLKSLYSRHRVVSILAALMLISLCLPQLVWGQCASTVPATTLDNATTNPFTYSGLAGGMSMTINNTTDAVVNVTANSGYRLGGATAANRVYKITFSKPVSCATLYFSEMDNVTAAERLTGFSTNDSLAVAAFTNTSTGGSSNSWDAATKTITAGAGSSGSGSASTLTYTADVAFTEIYFLYNRLTPTFNPGGVLLTRVDFTESTIAPVSLCRCVDNLNCGLNIYANQTTAFTAYDGQTGVNANMRSQNLLHNIAGHAYPMCVDYTTGALETRIAVRQLVTSTSTCGGFSRVYAVTLESDCATPATFVGANLTGGTRNFQFYDVLPNTTYRLCATVSHTQCHERTTGEFQPEYTSSTWYVFNASPAPATFTYNCGTASVTGTFLANGTAGQMGTLTVPMTGATAGPANFSVSGTGFTGSLSTSLTAGQTSVTIPITYDGTGAAGSRTLTVTSAQGTGTCTRTVTVLTPPTSFTYPFNCTGSTFNGTFIANGITGQMGSLVLPINVTQGGTTTLTVAGTNISGSLTTTIAQGQASLTIPITYTGAGTEGSRLLTITSPEGTGTCTVSIPIQAACKANGGQIGQ